MQITFTYDPAFVALHTCLRYDIQAQTVKLLPLTLINLKDQKLIPEHIYHTTMYEYSGDLRITSRPNATSSSFTRCLVCMGPIAFTKQQIWDWQYFETFPLLQQIVFENTTLIIKKAII